jgi:hypothetical protein
MSVSCETDYRPEPSGKCSENDAARKALFERLLGVAVEKMREWMFKPDQDAEDMLDLPSGVQPGDYVRKLEKALEPVLSVEGAIEQAKRTERKITCREDERLFQCLDAVAEAQKVMQPVATAMELAPGAKS